MVSSRFSLSLRALFCTLAVLLLPAFALGQTGAVVVSTNTTWPTGTYSLTSLTVNAGATLTVGGGSSITVSGAVLVTANANVVLQGTNTTAASGGVGSTINAASVEVDSGSSINADGQGYGVQAGPGAAAQGSTAGGSYGGAGGQQAATSLYGSTMAPVDLGSGGGAYQGTAGAGGGAIRLIVSGTLTDNGVISANGAAGSAFAGGGSGGSIYVTAGTLAGASGFTANGGNGGNNGAGGGGGRIAVQFGSAGSYTGFTVSQTVGGIQPGNTGANVGGVGTIGFFGTSTKNGSLNVYQQFPLAASTTATYDAITVSNGGTLTVGGGSNLTVTGAITVTGKSQMVLQGLNTSGPVGGAYAGSGVTLNAATVQVDAGSSINADAQGYAIQAGPGAAPQGSNNGGSYGGAGGQQAANTTYGSVTAPTDLGSGGGQYQGTAGAGGGAIRLIVSGTLTDNGTISAIGGAGSSFAGGGSGGSVYVTAGTLTGAGTFLATGGVGGGNGSGGGGGRIAVYYTTGANFTGYSTSTAAGGGPAGSSGNVGTVSFFNTASGGGGGESLNLYQNFTLPASTTMTYTSVTVQNGATLTIGGGSNITVSGTILVTGNSQIVLQSINNAAQVNGVWAGAGSTLTAASLQVDAGSSINGDLQGYLPSAGPGAGPGGSGNGGSYGGAGGSQASSTTYGSDTAPVDLGSGGGQYQGATTPGGGAVRLVVSGTLTNNGTITANAAPVSAFVGGSAGGSVYVTTSTLAGAGTFNANGGANTSGNGAGGGGGRVAVYYATASAYTGFTGSSASGGMSGTTANPGPSGAVGTVEFVNTTAANQNLNLYQNFVIPAGTTMTYNTITVQNGATLTIGGGSAITVTGALLVTGNSNIVLTPINNTAQVNGTWQGMSSKIIAGSVEVDAGSTINADGQGYAIQAGPGAGLPGDSKGGSYGGAGGGQAVSTTYGSNTAPVDLGSGGGQYQGAASPGGGAVQLQVTGTLLNNGVISANAAGVSAFAGGGSGGSVYVIANALTGNGTFNANGGPNSSGNGRGGGGGRVAIYSNTAAGFTGFTTSTATGASYGGTDPAQNGTNGTIAFFDTSATNSNVSIYQNYVIPASSTVAYNSLSLQNGALLTIGGGTTVNIAGALTVTGKSTVLAQGLNTAGQVNGVYAGVGVTINAGSAQVDAGSVIDADGQGYAIQTGPGAGLGGDSKGGSYGGAGGAQAASTTYGSSTAPVDLGSGGGQYQGAASAGGGAIKLAVAGMLTNNGIISANALGVNAFAGGGSGGSIYVTTQTLAGAGTFNANGGANSSGNGRGGGGGRVAIYSASAKNFTGFSTSTATGGTYGGTDPTNNGANGTIAFFDTSVANNNVSIYQNYTLAAGSNTTFNSLTLAGGATLNIGGSAQLLSTGTIDIAGTVLAQSVNNTAQVNGVYVGRGIKITAGTLTVEKTGVITADGQGYPATTGPGAGVGGDSRGGSYGGLGGGETTGTYGSATAPIDLGSGGGVYQGTGGTGGGAIQIFVAGTFTNNGSISANSPDVNGFVGGGSGGSVYIGANTIAGAGTIAANGSANASGNGYGGGGGRIAIDYVNDGGLNRTLVTATGGVTPNGTSGAAGTINFVNAPISTFLLPTQNVLHGTVTLSWFTDAGASTTVTLSGPQTYTVATGTTPFSTSMFDTTMVPDGAYVLDLKVLDANGKVLQDVARNVVINNTVIWYTGTLTGNTHWTAGNVYGLDGNVYVPSGVTLTIDPGTVIKALPGSQLIVQTGGTLNALGTATAPIIFTTFDDYTAGGNTDYNQGISVPSPGEWGGVYVQGGGTFTSNSNTVLRYVQTVLSGTLGANTTLLSTQNYVISGTLVVPSGVALTVQPGTVIKFNLGAGIDVQANGSLIANGTLAQPIYFTSVNDTSVGANTSSTGAAPAPGDWNSILIDGAVGSFSHVQMQYGGGPAPANGQTGMLETNSTAMLTVDSSTIASSYAIGLQTGLNQGGDVDTITNSIFYGNEDRAINAYGGSVVHVVNSTFDGNASGIFAHGGVIDVANSTVTNSVGAQFGQITVCCGGSFSLFKNNDVYGSATTTTIPNFSGLTDPTGTSGNISVAPVYMNAAQRDYRPNYGSPLIDAGNGTVANYPAVDSFGIARYNAPLVTAKTGTPDANGKYPDIGAFEFVQSAPSNLDLTVSNVDGPASATVGSQATVTWTVTNIGMGTVYGPWHDSVFLVTAPGTNQQETLAGTVLEGQGVVLGPGASYSATGTITVPGVTAGDHRWEVKTNVRGEVFEGVNTANNTAIGIGMVSTDLPQLLVGGSALSGSFSATGQSAYYKVIPAAGQAVSVQLALQGGVTGGVQLFVGAGYVPSPQQYDYTQVQFDASTASVVIPAGSGQTYYVTAYAQSITGGAAAFSIQASAVTFGLTSVTPNAVVNGGISTLTFTGGNFTSSTVFSLTGPSGTTLSPTSVFLSDEAHASLTFDLTSAKAGMYSATASNGTPSTLPNALTVSNLVTNLPVTGGADNLSLWLETPEVFRSGFPAPVTLYYKNASSQDIAAPVILLTASGATLYKVVPQCSGCSSNFLAQTANTANSGLVLGINGSGPAGVLPAGAQGSVQFTANATGSSVTFSSEALSGQPDTLLGYGITYGNLQGCTAGPAVCDTIYETGLYGGVASLCAAYTPPFGNTAGFTRACMQLLNKTNFKFNVCPQGIGFGIFNCDTLDGNSINQVIANDATQLSSIGIRENDAVRLFAYEFQIDGVDLFNLRYHQGAFGYGPSHQYDIYAQSTSLDPAPAIIYPDGSVRQFPTQNPAQTNQYLGVPGDYGVLTVNTDASLDLQENDGSDYHFAAPNSSRFQLTSIKDLKGNVVTLNYNSAGLLGSTVDSTGYTTTYTYDNLGHITQIVDPVGRTSTYTYDVLNDSVHSTFLRSITDATGTTSITWNEGGPNGVGYIADSCVSTFCEAAIGVTQVAYPDGTHAYYTYDAVGRLTGSSSDGGANATSYSYGAQGTVTVTDALGNATQTLPNQYGVPGEIIDPLQHVTQYIYDSEIKNIGVQGPLGTHTTIGYDSMANIAQVIDPLGNLQSFTSNAYGSLQAYTDANGNGSAVTYDAFNNPTETIGSDGRGTLSTYDARGNLLTHTNARGRTIQYSYNSKNLLTTKTLANGSQVTYTYDAHNNPLTITAANGTTSYTYDTADRLLSVTYPNGSALHYTYNSNGLRASMTDSTGFTVQYGHDAAGRLSTLTSGSNAAIATYTYDGDGRIAKKTLGNGTYTVYTYDADGNPVKLVNYMATGGVLSEYDYTYDALNRKTASATPYGSGTYVYDADSQITGATVSGTAAAYTYDPAGNRLTGSGFPYIANNLDEYQTVGSTPYTYDADGNLVSGGGVTYTYDDENRLLSSVSSADTWSYQYDGSGTRISATHNGVTTQYLNDPSGYGNVVAELNASGQATSHYTYGADLVSAVPASGSPAYYNFDAAGNTVQMTNSAGAVVNSYNYLPFGEKLVSNVSVPNPFTFVGRYGVRDDGSGLLFMRNRFYNPSLGRFVQRDPIGLQGGTNLYAYTFNQPTNLVDPLGTCPPDITANSNDPTIQSHKEALQVLYEQGVFSQSPGQRAAQIAQGSQGIVNVGIGAATAGLPNVPLIPNGPANAAANLLLSPYSHALQPVNYGDCPNPPNPPTPPTPPTPPLPPPPGPVAVLKDMANYFSGGRLFQKPPPPTVTKPVGKPIDPNGKITSGYGDAGFVPAGAAITYTVYFENQPTASLPAQKVTVIDALSNNFDLSTLQITQVAFNNTTVNVPAGSQTFNGQATVPTDTNPVNIAAALNPATGVLTFTMQSVDAITGGIPANPLSGFLPPNNAANAGFGSVTFTVQPRAGLANATTITNQASITFDVNAAILTNTVSNVLDTAAITSAINPLPSTSSTTFAVGWTGSDPSGAGIAAYNIYVSVDGGAYALWLSGTTATTANYTGVSGHTYSFESLASNNVGIQQTTPAAAQTTRVVSTTAPTVTVTPAASSITTAQALSVGVAVTSGSGTPTGTVVLSSGTYTSTAVTLASGAATVVVPAGALAPGTDTLTVTYTPDTAGSATFTGATGTATVTVAAVVSTQQVTVSATPTGASFTVDGTAYTTSQTFTWTIGSSHTLATTSPQTGGALGAGTQLTFTSWSDGGALSHTVTATAGTATYTAAFSTAYQLTTAANPGAGGTVSPATGTFYPAGTVVPLVATPAAGYSFTSWTGPVASSTSASTTVTLTAAQTVTANFTLTPVATVSLTPATLTFSSVAGTPSAAQAVTLKNTGTAALTVSGITLTGTNSTLFAQTNTCGTSVAAGASCTINVTFTPAVAGSYTAAVSIADNASGSPQTVALTGTGTAVAAPAVTLTPTTLTFTGVAGTASAAQTVTLKNTGTAALTVSSITVGGTNAGLFTQTNTCGTGVAAGATCTVSVTFTPAAAGTFSASLAIADNATGTPQSVSLAGTATAALAPAVSLNPTALTFSTAANSTTAAQTVTLTNTGTAALTLSSVAVTGTNATSFAETNTCGASVAAGASCTVAVTFSPTAVGSYTATLTFADNAAVSPQAVTLTGTATTAASFSLSATPTIRYVLPGDPASYTLNLLSVGGTYNNAVLLTVSGLPAGATANFQPNGVTPGAAGASSTLTVQTLTKVGRLAAPGGHGSSRSPLGSGLPAGTAFAALGTLLYVGRKRRRWLVGCVLTLLSLAVISGLSGCGTKSQQGTYTLTITATGGTGANAVVQTTTVTLQIQ